MKKSWSLPEKWGIAIAVIAIVIGVATPEVRRFFGLEKPTPIVTIPPSISPLPSAPAAPAPATVSEAPKSKSATNEHATHRTKINGNGNTSQVSTGANSPNVSAPNGITIVGNRGTVNNPTVNNFAPPQRRLSDEERNTLVPCLRTNPGTFTIGAELGGDARRYAEDWSEVFSLAGWKNEQPIPYLGIMIVGGSWTGIRLTLFGKIDDNQRTSLVSGSPERTAFDCLNAAHIAGTAVADKDLATGRIRIDVRAP